MPGRMRSPMTVRVLLWGGFSPLERHMVEALRSEGYEVMVAANGRQALDITGSGSVDVLVLNFDLHSREFSQLALIVRCTQNLCRTVVLADSLEQLIVASEAQVDGVLMKPLGHEQVKSVIHNLRTAVRKPGPAQRSHHQTASSPPALSFLLNRETDGQETPIPRSAPAKQPSRGLQLC